MSGNSDVLESSAVPETAGDREKDVKLENSGVAAAGSGGGNRWPRQEALALLRIRSDMNKSFRDSTLKAPLWEEISRKMSELGYKRSAKKCKEKFENVYKYHKRTKEGRSSKPEGKSYRFFDELEAFETLHSNPPEPKSQTQTGKLTTTTAASLVPWRHDGLINSPTLFSKQLQSTTPFVINHTTTHSLSGKGDKTISNHFTNYVSSSTASEGDDEEEEERMRSRKKMRYWKGLFKRMTKELMEKQDELQMRFLKTFEERELERIAREDAWRLQETARINREHEILVHERSMTAAKDAAIISFLQKASGQQPKQQQQPYNHAITLLKDQRQEQRLVVEAKGKMGNGHSNNPVSPSTSRWPKAEVEALIRLRTNVDANYQETITKGSVWEEISDGMRGLGYNRSSKRCKEKWENINKYFKKVKESNKKRPMDSKTCPYFHQLEAIHKEKNKAETSSPLMAAPQQQQLLLPQETHNDSEKQKTMDPVGDEEGDTEEEDEEQEGEGDNERQRFEMVVLNKTCSPMDINHNVFT